MTDTKAIVDSFSQPSMWNNPAAREIVLLLIRRYAAEGTAAGYDACAKLLRAAPTQYADSTHEYLRKGLAERAAGLQGIGQGDLYGEQAAGPRANRSPKSATSSRSTPALKDFIAALWQQKRDDPARLELALRAGVDDAYPDAKGGRVPVRSTPEERAPSVRTPS